MGDELLIRSVQESDRNGILNLVKLSLGKGSTPRSREYWSWKHELNPFGSSAAIIAESEGEIVGLRVFMRWVWSSGDEMIRAVRAVDTATHPNWRGQGIFSRLTRALVEQMRDEGISFIFNTPNRYSRPGYLKMGWTSLGRVSLWVRPCHAVRLARGILGRLWSKSSIEQDPPNDAYGFPAVSDLLKQAEIERFERPRQSNDLSCKTPVGWQYLNWRYAKIPGLTYSAVWKWRNNVGAAIIFRVNQRGDLRELRLCQTLLDSSRSSPIARELLIDVIKETRADYAVGMTATSEERRALAGAGFMPAPRMGPNFTVRQLNTAIGSVNPLERSAWSLCIGDLELF